MVIDIPREELSLDGELDESLVYVGATLPLQSQDGQRFLARVVNIGEESVRVDLNHPLAGKDLTFRGHVIVSREASDEEIDDLKKKLHHHHCGNGECSGGNCGNGESCGGNCGNGHCGDDGCGDGTHCGSCGGCH